MMTLSYNVLKHELNHLTISLKHKMKRRHWAKEQHCCMAKRTPAKIKLRHTQTLANACPQYNASKWKQTFTEMVIKVTPFSAKKILRCQHKTQQRL